MGNYYWTEHTLWSDGYFSASVGDASSETIQEYITTNNTGNVLSIFGSAIIECYTHPLRFHGLHIGHVIVPFFGFTLVIGYFIWMEYLRSKVVHQDRPGEEAGSARFMTARDMKGYNKKYVCPFDDVKDIAMGKRDPNIIIADGLKLWMDGDATQRNINTLICGGSGSGKTFRFIKPSIAQMNASFITTDPSGEILRDMGRMLLEYGYKVQVFSTSDMKHSNCYNPFDYIYTLDKDANGKTVKVIDETKVTVMVDTFMKNADQSKKSGGDPFWDKAATAWLRFAVLFLAEFCGPEDRNMYNMLRLAQSGKAPEDASSTSTVLDTMVAAARDMNPNAKCFVSYDTFKLAPAKTANSILITLGVNLEPFGSADKVRNMTTTDYLCRRNNEGKIIDYIRDKDGNHIRMDNNLDLEKVGDVMTALFVNIPQANGAYNFLVSMMYAQMFDALYDRAEKKCPEVFNIYDDTGIALSSMYETEEEAKEALRLFQNAKIVKLRNDHNVEKYYLYNKEAPESMSLKTLVYSPWCGKTGYLMEVYDEKQGNITLNRFRNAKVEHGGPFLPVYVRCLLDEFANIGEIPNFNQLLATMRKYHISASIVLQSLGQIKDKYEKLWESMIGNCDIFLYLGSSENETNKYVSEKLGKQTIRTANMSESKGRSGSTSMSFQHTGRDLMDMAEVGKLDNSMCLVMIRGVNPFKIKKYDFTKHPHWKETGTCNKDLRITAQYMDEHFLCLGKDTIRKEKVSNTENNAKNTTKGQKNPNGTSKGVGTRPTEVPNVKTFENAANVTASENGFEGINSVDAKEYDHHEMQHAEEQIPSRLPKTISEMEEDFTEENIEEKKTETDAGQDDAMSAESIVKEAEQNMLGGSPLPDEGSSDDDLPFADDDDTDDSTEAMDDDKETEFSDDDFDGFI